MRAQFQFSLELVAMVAVIAISSWHVGNYMNTFDGWIMASIMGATLGFCNFLMAHNIFKPHSTSRLPSFCGLIFFACTSTYMQYTYFNADTEIGKTMVLSVNLDALTLGIWAPAAEILLGWIYAAGLQSAAPAKPTHHVHASKFERLTEALTGRLEQRLNASATPTTRSTEHQPSPTATSSPLPDHSEPHPPVATRPPALSTYSNGQSSTPLVHIPNQLVDTVADLTDPSMRLNRDLNVQPQTQSLTKEEAIEHILNIYRTTPTASYEEIGRSIGRSKGTVANYVKVLKERQQIRITDDKVEVLV